MRSSLLLYSLSTSVLMSGSAAAATRVPQGPPVPAYKWMKDLLADEARQPAKREASRDAEQRHQKPLMDTPGIALPPGPGDEDPGSGPSAGGTGGSRVTISDVLPSSRGISIFSGFTRDVGSVSTRLEDRSLKTTVLVPDNDVVRHLGRKPWEDPKDYEQMGTNAYAGTDGEDRAQKNLQRFVEAHVVTESPWEEGRRVKTMAGGEVWWESKDGKKLIQPGNVEVDSVASKASNGQVWIVKGVVNHS